MKILKDLAVSGQITVGQLLQSSIDTDKFLVAENGVVKFRTGSQILSDIGGISGNQNITLSGDASGSGTTAITVTLANSGVTAGTYNNVTVDAKGRVTAGSNVAYLTSLPSHNHDGRYIRLDAVNELDGVIAHFRPATSGGYTMMKFESKVNQGSDYGWILMQDDSANTNGAPTTEDVRMTIGVFNDFQGPGVHSDELWFQGGARLVQNVGSWDSEYNTIIGTPAAKTNGTTYEWRINNSPVMAVSFAGVLSVGGNNVWHAGNLTNLNQLTNGPGYITSSSLSAYLPLSGGVMTGSIVNNTDGAVIIESNASENNNWLWKENAKAWGLFWFNRGSQSGQTIGGYTTVGAELMFMGENSGIAMPSGWTGYHSTSKIAAMISNVNGYIYSASTVYAATSMVVGGNTVLHAGNYNSYSPTLTGGSASGTWGINVTGSAGSLSNMNISQFTNNSGYITQTNALQPIYGDSGAHNLNVSGQQSNIRFSTGLWVNAPTSGNYSHVISFNLASDNRTVQMYLGDVPGYLWWRPNQGGTWHPWERILTSNNYNSWAPTLTGGGASGTWGINITGNSATTSQTNFGSLTVNSNTVLHAGNYTSWAAPRNYVGDSYVDFYIYGDQNTYYPVTIQNYNNGYGFQRYSISRGYSWTAPWNPIGTGSHQGGLTFTFEWAGDIAWGGNDKSFRIIEFAEQYTTMVAGMQLAHCEGLIVWLRGGGSGGAHYRLHGPGGIVQGYSINMSSWTSCAGVTYSPRSYDSGTVNSEINSKYPIRGHGNSDIYVNNSIVWHQGNLTNLNQLSNGPGYITSSSLSSYLPLSGGTLSGNLYIQSGANPSQIILKGTNSELYVDSAYGGGTSRIIINRQSASNQATLLFTTAATVTNGSAWNSTGAPLWSMGMTNSSQTSDFKIAYGDIYDAASVAVRIDTNKIVYFTNTPYVGGNIMATQSWVTSQGYLTSGSFLSSNTDSEQTIGGRIYYFNDGVKRMNADPRWNESGYDADLGCLHIWAWTAGGSPYGRAGIALYNDGAYQYLTTKSGTSGMFVNNTQIVTNSGTWGINITGNAATVGSRSVGNSAGNIAYYDSNGNLYVNNPESYSGEVRLGAAWGRGGVYASSTLSMSTSSGNINFVSNDTTIGGFRWDSTNGSRFIVSHNDIQTPYTLVDSNKRPIIYARGAYPVLVLDHTETGNTNHGPTIQFAHNGSGARQWVIGTNGFGGRLDIGYSDSATYGNSNYNPHNGIAGYLGKTIIRIIPSGVLIGDCGTYPTINTPTQALHVNGKGYFSNNIMIYPQSESWAEGLSFTVPSTSTWAGIRWRRERASNDGNWYVGYTALDSSDDLVFGANNGGSQVDNIIRLSKSGIVSAKYGYVSYGNPWGTSDSAYFPNGITSAGGTNWIYGFTYIGNAPSNGSGAEVSSVGRIYVRNGNTSGTWGYAGLFIDRNNAANNYTPWSFENEYGNHSWGLVARFHIQQSGADRPSIQFSSSSSDTRWSVGYVYPDDNFRVTQNHGIRPDGSTNDGWGTERFRINADGTTILGIQGQIVYFNGAESANLYGIRGRFTNEYIHLYNKVGIGHPNGWGQGEGNTPTYGLSTYGGANIGYGNSGGLTVSGTTTLNSQVYINRHIDANTTWGNCGCTSLFLGWSTSKIIIGNNASGAHDWANDRGANSIISTVNHFFYNNIYAREDVIAYWSDARLKDNVRPIEGALEKITKIGGYYYTPSKLAVDLNATSDMSERVGVMAQEIEEVLPHVVKPAPFNSDYKTVQYEKLVPLLIEAVKEQQIQIEDLKKQINNK